MEHKAKPPGVVLTPAASDYHSWPNVPEDTTRTHRLQVFRLADRFGLPVAVAEVVATLAYGVAA